MKLRFAPILLAGLLLGGCSDLARINPFSYGGAGQSKAVPLPPIDNPVVLTPNWQSFVGFGLEASFTPSVSGNVVTAASNSGTIVRFENGVEVWRIRAKQQISAGVGTDGQYVALGTPKGVVVVLDSKGELYWSAQANSEILAPPVYYRNMLIVRSADNRISAFEKTSGKRLWTYQRPVPALSLRSAAGVTLGDGVAYAGFAGGKLVALNLNNGTPLWESTVAVPRGTTELDRIADVTSDPAISGREICGAAYHGRVACFDIGTGETLWGRDVSSSRGLTMDNQRVYVSDENGNVVALDRDTGASVWKQDKLEGQRLAAPALLGNHLVVGDAKGNLHMLRKSDGILVGRTPTDGSPIVTQPKVVDGNLIVMTLRGTVYSFSP